MVDVPQVQDLLLNLRRSLPRVAVRPGATVGQTDFALSLIPTTPVLEALPCDPESPARKGNIARLVGEPQCGQLALDVPLGPRHSLDLAFSLVKNSVCQAGTWIPYLDARGVLSTELSLPGRVRGHREVKTWRF